MKRIGIICLAVLASIAIHAQTVTNVVAKQVGNTVEITYDIDKPAMVAFCCRDDGTSSKTYDLVLTNQMISGDVGSVTAVKDKPQTPSIKSAPAVSGSWKNWKLR